MIDLGQDTQTLSGRSKNTMGHIDIHKVDRAKRTEVAWLRVGAEIAELANNWAARNDIVAFIGEGAGEGLAPALFKPQIAEIEINTEIAFGFGVKPNKIGNINQKPVQYDFPKATGAIFHEACHARFSLWNITNAFDALKKDEFDALMLLEEGRIEAWGIKTIPTNRVFLRSCAFDLVFGDYDINKLPEEGVASLVRLVALLQARAVAGVLEEEDVAEVNAIITSKIGEDTFARLTEILQEFQAHSNHHNIEATYPLAIEWAKIIRNLQKENGEENNLGENGEGMKIPAGVKKALEKLVKEVKEAMQEAEEMMEIANAGEVADQQEAEEWEAQVTENKAGANEKNQAREEASKVFNKSTGPGQAKTRSKLLEERNPNDGERKAAVIISRLLEKAKYRERDLTEVATELPSGRLNPRALIQNEAMKAKGVNTRVPAWRKKVRKHTDEPTLSVGVMVDISGSMRSAMQPMATTAWVMSEAVKRVQGKTAMVYYGNDVFPTLKPGQALDKVRVYDANDGTEKFDDAFKALDGGLNLLHGDGVRMLVVVSDGEYTPAELRNAEKWIRRCHSEGVAVLWLTFDGNGRTASRIVGDTNAVVIFTQLNPEEVATEIGRACATALERATAMVA
jgi:hypothetical protein